LFHFFEDGEKLRAYDSLWCDGHLLKST
jgi:hypothetical protein